MQFSEAILQRAGSPHFKNIALKPLLSIELKRLACWIDVSYDIQNASEVCIQNLQYNTDLKNDYLGVLDGYMSLCEGKPIEVLDRITPKELDYFLRDKANEVSFEFYSAEIYEILSLGEKIYQLINGEKIKPPFYAISLYGDYTGLSFSEQIEWFEEFCAEFIYPDTEVEMSIEDITETDFIFSGTIKLELDFVRYVENKFNTQFFTKMKFCQIFEE
jgi:hypothetical protein